MIHESCKRAVVEMLRERANEYAADAEGGTIDAKWAADAWFILASAADAVAAMPVEEPINWQQIRAERVIADRVAANLAATRQRLEKAEELLRTVKLRTRYIINFCRDVAEILLEAQELNRLADAFLKDKAPD